MSDKTKRLFTLEEVEGLTYDAMKSVTYTPLQVWRDWADKNLK